jgi:hypothetical protein
MLQAAYPLGELGSSQQLVAAGQLANLERSAAAIVVTIQLADDGSDSGGVIEIRQFSYAASP